jgi:hypothetical protein
MKGVEFSIDFKEAFTQPFKERMRRCSPQERLAKILECKKMLKAEVIRPSQSPWASNVVMVKKKGWILEILCGLEEAEHAHKKNRNTLA